MYPLGDNNFIIFAPPKQLSNLLIHVPLSAEQSHSKSDELLELDEASAVDVNFIEHIINLAVRGILTHAT